MNCPVCKMTAGVDKNEIVKETPEKEYHRVSYICRNPRCVKYKKECASTEYEVDKPQQG